MASIERRGKRFIVRWRDPDGKDRARTCPDERTAHRVLEEVERVVAEGRRWEAADARPQLDLEDVLAAYMKRCARMLGAATAERYARSLDTFVSWMKDRYGRRQKLTPSMLSTRLLDDFFVYLGTTGLHGRPRSKDTCRKVVEVVQLAWKFGANHDEYADQMPPPRTIEMPRSPPKVPIAPRWHEMDGLIWRLVDWTQQVAVIQRFTGVRIAQATFLKWDDVNLDEATLIIRGELGKSKQERRGRAIPISRHLVAVLRAWGPRPGEYIVVASRGRGGDRERIARQRALRDAWAAAGVREDIWRRRPSHALRKGFISELKRSGADVEAVEFLVGHSIGLRGVYTDPSALPLRAAVDLVPPLSPPPEGTESASMAWWARVATADAPPVGDEAANDARVVKLVDVAQRNSTRAKR